MQTRSQMGLSTPATQTEQHTARVSQTSMQLSRQSAGPTLAKIRKLQTHCPTRSVLHTKIHQSPLTRWGLQYLHSNGSLCIRYFPGDTVHRLVKQYHQVSHLQQSESRHPWKTPAVVLHFSSQSVTKTRRGQPSPLLTVTQPKSSQLHCTFNLILYPCLSRPC